MSAGLSVCYNSFRGLLHLLL